jgi:hypothetical protein
MQEIIATFPLDDSKPDTIAVNGVKGEGCKVLTQGLEAALGDVTASDATEEMYESPVKEFDREHQR